MAYLVTTRSGSYVTSTLAEAKAVERAGGKPTKRKRSAKRRNPGDPQFWAGEVVEALVEAIVALEPAFTFDPVESVLFSSADSFSAAYDPELSQIEARIIVLRDGTVRVLSEVYGNVTFPPAGSAAEARNRAAQAVAWARRTFGRVENPAKSGKPANRGTWPDGCKWRLRKVPKSRGAATYAETQGEWEVSWTDPDGYTDGEFFGSEEAARRYVQSQQNPARRRRNPWPDDVPPRFQTKAKHAIAVARTQLDEAAAKAAREFERLVDDDYQANNRPDFYGRPGPRAFTPAESAWWDSYKTPEAEREIREAVLHRNPIAPGPAAGLLVRMRADGANTFTKKVAWVRKHMPTITGPQAFVAELTRAGGEKHRPRRKRK